MCSTCSPAGLQMPRGTRVSCPWYLLAAGFSPQPGSGLAPQLPSAASLISGALLPLCQVSTLCSGHSGRVLLLPVPPHLLLGASRLCAGAGRRAGIARGALRCPWLAWVAAGRLLRSWFEAEGAAGTNVLDRAELPAGTGGQTDAWALSERHGIDVNRLSFAISHH